MRIIVEKEKLENVKKILNNMKLQLRLTRLLLIISLVFIGFQSYQAYSETVEPLPVFMGTGSLEQVGELTYQIVEDNELPKLPSDLH